MSAIRIILSLFICVIYSVLVYEMANRARSVKIDWGMQFERLLDSSGKRMKKNERKYTEKRLYLSQIGVNYLMKRTVLPEEYFLFRVSLAIGIGILGMLIFSIGMGILFGFLGYCLPETVLQKNNEKNNKKMLRDVKVIYDTIQIKTQGGMFLTDAISECYRNVANPRLKRALYEMSGKMIMNHDLEATIDEFNLKFKDKYIDNLCIILKQALDSGKTVEIMESVQDQMADMQEVIAMQARNKAKRQVFFVEVLIFLVAFVVTMYMAILSVTATINM